MQIFWMVLLALASYFLGSISFGRIFTRDKNGNDVTKHGSGNPGGTNVLRSYGIKTGMLVYLCDILKGVFAALAGLLLFEPLGLFICGAAAVFGHCYPLIYKFKGGKGIATAVGVFFVGAPFEMTFVLIGMIIFVLLLDYMSVASLLCIITLTCVLSIEYSGEIGIQICLTIIFAITWIRHFSNIIRLLTGKENTTGVKKLLLKRRENKIKPKERKQEE